MRLCLLLLVTLVCLAASAITPSWSGRVLDIRTGEPVQDVRICGGWTGRVDVTNIVKSTPDGRYIVTYPDHTAVKAPEVYTLNAEPVRMPSSDGYGRPPFNSDYLFYEEWRPMPGNADIKMVPFWAHFKGRVVDADTNQPLANIIVILKRPGQYLSSVKTNANGEYSMRVGAYEAPWLLGTEGIDPRFQSKPMESHAKLITNYGLEANYSDSEGVGKAYAAVDTSLTETARAGLPLLSSVKPVIVTVVDFKLPKKTGAKPSAAHVAITPPRLPGAGGDLLTRLDTLIANLEAALAEAKALRDEIRGK